MRLPRPHVPIAVRVQVAERQFDALPIPEKIDPEIDVIERNRSVFRNWVNRASWHARSSAGDRLDFLLRLIFGEGVKVHLDHDPPLAARAKIRRGGAIVGYRPAANDPRFLIYREASAHRIKTNVRGEHGQHPDRVLIARQRKLERKARPKPKRKWAKRKLRSRGFERRAP